MQINVRICILRHQNPTVQEFTTIQDQVRSKQVYRYISFKTNLTSNIRPTSQNSVPTTAFFTNSSFHTCDTENIGILFHLNRVCDQISTDINYVSTASLSLLQILSGIFKSKFQTVNGGKLKTYQTRCRNERRHRNQNLKSSTDNESVK